MEQAATPADNPARAHVAQVVASGRRNVPLDASPASASLSTMLVESREHEVVLRFTAPPSATQGHGVVGGGTLANMLDLAMATIVLSRLKPGCSCATISLTVNMLAAGKQGDFIAIAAIDKVGRKVAFARASLYGPDGTRLVATATSSLAIIGAAPGYQDHSTQGASHENHR